MQCSPYAVIVKYGATALRSRRLLISMSLQLSSQVHFTGEYGATVLKYDKLH